MKWLRRLHLYSGLLLFPWILLYGVTAFLFNHPGAFSSRGSGETVTLTQRPAAEKLAQELMSVLRAKWKASTGTEAGLELLDPASASFSRNLVASTTVDGQSYSVSVDLNRGEGVVRERGPRSPQVQQGPAVVKGKFVLPSAPLEGVKEELGEALREKGIEADDLTVQGVPDLVFHAAAEGKTWELRYNLQRGTIQAKDLDAPAQLTALSFLTRLHKAHGYPDEVGPRWFWAVLVDVMFVAMLFWGLSGLFMWWQLKAQRRIGVFLLAVSVLITAALTVGMHRVMAG